MFLRKNKYFLYLIFGLRKTRTFIKSKYTRTRQWSKSIVFFGLWFNLSSVYFTFLYCYQFYINILEYWWLFFLLFFSFLFRSFIRKIFNFPLFKTIFFDVFLLNSFGKQFILQQIYLRGLYWGVHEYYYGHRDFFPLRLGV